MQIEYLGGLDLQGREEPAVVTAYVNVHGQRPYSGCGDEGSESLGNMPETTRLVGNDIRIQMQGHSNFQETGKCVCLLLSF